MKVIVCDNPGTFTYQEKSKPASKKEEAIIKIKRIGICGTDLHAFEGTQPFFSYPRILGHELSGNIESISGVSGFQEGEPVTFIPYFHCGKCLACRNGLTNCCSAIRVCGVHIDGGMAEYLSVPTWSLVPGNGLTFDELALVEPMAIGCHGVRRAEIKNGENVLVVGAGPIGLGIIEFARIAGGNVTVMDLNEKRLRFCREKLNVTDTINPMESQSVEKMLDLTNGEMFSVVIDATGSQRAINESFKYLSHGSRFVLVGLQKGDITFSHPEFHKREATLMSSRNATRADFEFVVKCLKEKLIDTNLFITHRVRFDEVADQFESWLKPETGVIKAMVEV